MRNILKIIFLVLSVVVISIVPFMLLTSADSQNNYSQQTKIIEKQIIKTTEKIIEKQPTTYSQPTYRTTSSRTHYSKYPKYTTNYKYKPASRYKKAYQNKYKKSKNHRSGINYKIDRVPRTTCNYRTCSVTHKKTTPKRKYKIPTRNYIPSKYIRYYP
jgi:hypothetical protein